MTTAELPINPNIYINPDSRAGRLGKLVLKALRFFTPRLDESNMRRYLDRFRPLAETYPDDPVVRLAQIINGLSERHGIDPYSKKMPWLDDHSREVGCSVMAEFKSPDGTLVRRATGMGYPDGPSAGQLLDVFRVRTAGGQEFKLIATNDRDFRCVHRKPGGEPTELDYFAARPVLGQVISTIDPNSMKPSGEPDTL